MKEDWDGDEIFHHCGFIAAHSFCAALAAQSWKTEQEWKNKKVGKMMAIPLILRLPNEKDQDSGSQGSSFHSVPGTQGGRQEIQVTAQNREAS